MKDIYKLIPGVLLIILIVAGGLFFVLDKRFEPAAKYKIQDLKGEWDIRHMGKLLPEKDLRDLEIKSPKRGETYTL